MLSIALYTTKAQRCDFSGEVKKFASSPVVFYDGTRCRPIPIQRENFPVLTRPHGKISGTGISVRLKQRDGNSRLI